MSDKKWYIVNAHSGCENKAKASLEERIKASKLGDLFGRVLIPTETVPDNKKGEKATKKPSTRKFYPGYILVEMELNEQTWHLVKGTPKISGFIGGGSPPAMSEKEIQSILDKMTNSVEMVDVVTTLDINDTVRILSGSFANFTGSVNSIDREKSKVSVMVSILGRVVPVDLEFKQVERVDA